MRGDNGHMCIELLEDKRDKILMKNNSIVKAKYNLTTNESKVFLLMLFKMQKVNEGVLSCNITYDEFKDSIKSTRDNTIKNISNILSNLRSEEHTSELQSRQYLVCRLLLEKKKKNNTIHQRITANQYTKT